MTTKGSEAGRGHTVVGRESHRAWWKDASPGAELPPPRLGRSKARGPQSRPRSTLPRLGRVHMVCTSLWSFSGPRPFCDLLAEPHTPSLPCCPAPPPARWPLPGGPSLQYSPLHTERPLRKCSQAPTPGAAPTVTPQAQHCPPLTARLPGSKKGRLSPIMPRESYATAGVLC